MENPGLIRNTFMINLSKVVHNNLSNELFGVEELAQALGMSRGHLYRKIRRLTGYSPNMFLNIIRLYYGKELLSSDNFTIAEVAYKVGFNSNTYFIKCFSDHFGMSPGKFKQQGLGAKQPVTSIPTVIQVFRTIISTFENQGLQKNTQDNLPSPATRFFGREKEIDAIIDLLANRKMVSIIGVGGSGKTRVAIEAGRNVKHLFPDGVWFINLAPITQGRLVINAFGEVFNIKDQDADVMLKTITSKISNRNVLLIIDNCEHLADECARILAHLLNFTLRPKFLITSRELLKVSGEATFVIPPLPIPDAEQSQDHSALLENESVQLFVDRAQLVRPGFTLNPGNGEDIIQLCEKLDGIPLAIELAASRVRIMSPGQIVERLKNEFKVLSTDTRNSLPRHKTLEATLDWSINLLTEKERILFYRLSIFNSDFDLEGAESICCFKPFVAQEISDIVFQLADKSLLTIVEDSGVVRYKLLEIMKQYAGKKIEEKEMEQLRDRYLVYYTSLASQAFEYRIKGNPPVITKLEIEQDNIVGALERARSQPNSLAVLSGYLAWFWYERSKVFVATEYLNQSLRSYKDHDVTMARLLFGLALMQAWYTESDSEAGLHNAELAVNMLSEDDPELLNVLPQYAMIQIINREYASAEKILLSGMNANYTAGNPALMLRYKIFYAWNFINQHRPDVAEPTLNEIHSKAGDLGNEWDITVFKHIYADIPLLKGEYELAELRYIESMKSAFQSGNVLQAAIELLGVAMSVAGQGRHRKALRLNGAFFEKFEELNAKMPRLKFWDDCYARTLGKSIESIGNDEAQLLTIEGRSMGFDAARLYAMKVHGD
jgi:predicted ATPase/AraC-like DNA-binding protein